MDDPQRELKQWLADKVRPHGEATKLAQATGLTGDKITRSKELESTDPKKRRTLQYEEIRAIAMYFGELPPGYEGMKQWLRDAGVLTEPDQIPKAEIDAEAQLRTALLAFGVDRKSLSRAVATVRAGFVKAAETPTRTPHGDQSALANRRRESEPSR